MVFVVEDLSKFTFKTLSSLLPHTLDSLNSNEFHLRMYINDDDANRADVFST